MQTAANGRWEASIPCPPQWPTGDNRDTHRRGGGEWDSEPGSQPPEAPGVGLRMGTQWASVSVYVAVCVGEGLVCLHSWNQGLTFHVSLLLSLLVPTPVLGPSSRASGPS